MTKIENILFVFVLIFSSMTIASTSNLKNEHTPPFVFSAADLGAEDPSKEITIHMWMNLNNTAKLKNFVDQAYDKTSPHYRKWLSHDQFKKMFGPTSEQTAKVKKFLTARGLSVVSTDPDNLFVTAQGTVGEVENAFSLAIHNFRVNGKIVRANTSDPAMDAETASLVMRVGGLSSHGARPLLSKAIDPASGMPYEAIPLTALSKETPFETECFRDPQTVNFATTGIQATYTGNRFGSDLTDTAHLPPCGYDPATVETAYGMKALYKKNLDGRGQTIAIVDAYGSPTLPQDDAVFTKQFGLPDLQLEILQPSGPPVTGPWNAGEQDWASETTMDVQYAHAMAPGAKIALIEALSDQDDDLAAGLAYVVQNHVGDVVSDSWGGFESQEDPSSMKLYEQILQSASAMGISMHFGSGDWGDLIGQEGYADAFYPGDSVYATSVGGVSLALNADKTIKFQTGWGNNSVLIGDKVSSPAQSAAAQNAPLNPPTVTGFVFGAGGGASRIFAKPEFQHKLPGKMRMFPDIAYLADPYTGVEVIESTFDTNGNPISGSQKVGIWGGTSLATPLFTALWAVADQRAGMSLGQASQALYQLGGKAITDIVPVGSATDVSGSILGASGTIPESPLNLSVPETTAPFFSALYDSPNSPYYWHVLSFGTDSSLSTAPGWDEVTGLGVPNGEAFIEAAAWNAW